MGEGIQITIPDFDDDDYSSAPTPFGRSAGGAFGFGSGLATSLDSPTLSTPVADRSERSYFPSHSRVDSGASEDSTTSATMRYTSKPFAHSSQLSTSTTFSKKPSFASIRNAFKSGRSNDTPPVPSVDHAYPVLKNPFNRSTSSLGRLQIGSTNGPSPPFPYPSTPSLGTRPGKAKFHVTAKSQSGSIFYASDIGSDHGHQYPSSPPPVPRMPDGLGHFQRSDTPPISDDDENITMNPKTPSDYALHAVFIRFAASAETVIDKFLRHGLESEPLLPLFIGVGVDSNFDEILQSLAKIAQRHAKPVIDSIMRWRRSQYEPVTHDIVDSHASQSPLTTRSTRLQDIAGILAERKSLVAIYIMCRALIAVMQSTTKDALGEDLGHMLEEKTFDQFRKPDVRLLSNSLNHRATADLYATLLGHIANIRFMSVTDRFLAELDPVAQGQVPKDLHTKYESLIRGLQHIQIKVWPPEAFEEGAEFMEAIAKSFVNAHGQQFKTVFTETLTRILHPIGKTAQAETNNPQWAKSIEMIYPKAKEMMSKPRYWPIAFPLAITSLCVAHQSYFLKHWLACFDSACSKLKEKPLRIIAMNGIIRLVWTYLYRCQESASSTTTRMEGLLKYFFPSNRLAIFPSEDCLEQLTYLVHFVLSRHFDFGQDFCLGLLQESSVQLVQQLGGVFSPDRIYVGSQAILLTLAATEKDITTPAWPSTSDFSVVPARNDYPMCSEFVPASLLSKPGMKTLLDRCGSILASVAIVTNNSASNMSVFDDQWSQARLNGSQEESNNYTIRRHPDSPTVAYPNQLVPHVILIQTCFQSWPRCLHPTITLPDAVDMLLRCVVHVEPSLGEAACATLQRFVADWKHVLIVLQCFADFLFNPHRMARGCSGVRLLVEFPKVLQLWVDVVYGWIRGLLQQPLNSMLDLDEIMGRCNEIERGALFLLTHETRSIHYAGVKVIRHLGLLADHILPADVTGTSLLLVQYLHGKGVGKNSYLTGYDELLESPELARLEQWRQANRIDVALRIADSPNEKDRNLWPYVFPAFLQASMDHGVVLGPFRDVVVASASRYHPFISHFAGLSTRIPSGLPIRTPATERDSPKFLRETQPLINQWRIWVKVLCATATLSESSRPALTLLGREHTRAPSDASFERERLSTTRGLFRYLTPFLDSEYTRFRDTAVVCISLFPSTAYPQLLEDLSLLAGRQFYDDPRSKAIPLPALEQPIGILSPRQFHDEARFKPGTGVLLAERSRRQERLHCAVAHIYYLTAHHLQLQRSAGRQAALANVLKFVRNTQAFLTAPEFRDNPTLQRLRRYFCGTVEQLFDGLATLKDSERFIPPHMHLALYRLCEDWCHFGPQSESAKKRNFQMLNAVASLDVELVNARERFKAETFMLSQAAVGALASLCQKAFYPPDLASASPTERFPPQYMRPLTLSGVLDRFIGILSSSHGATQLRGKKGLRSLLSHTPGDAELLGEAIKRAIISTDEADTSNTLVFETILDIVCNSPSHTFSFSQIVFLGLSNLRHPRHSVRRSAFRILEAIHQQSSGLLALSDLEAPVASCASSTYIQAHRLISEFLAGEHPDQALQILAQISNWLPHLPRAASNVTILILQSLEFWISNIQLMPEDRSTWAPGGLAALYHLISLTLHYGQSHAEQILTIWTKLVESPHLANGHATVRFLLEQSHKVGSIVYIGCAANIVACLCQTSISRQIFQELCSVIEPARILPTIEHKLKFPDASDADLWGDLGALFEDAPRLPLGSAQFAWLFLTDVAIQRSWELNDEMPTLLHALFTHLDHRALFVRQRARHMLFQCLRCWTHEEMLDRPLSLGRVPPKSSITRLEEETESMYWQEEEPREDCEPKIRWISSRILEHLKPLRPSIVDEWGSLALHWGTTCSIRGIAFRSLQIFRALMPRVKQRDLAMLLGRLSNTVSAADENLQSFTTEILQTITALTAKGEVDWSSLPQIFWCTCASLSTTVQQEFSQVLELLDELLMKIDLDDPDSVELLLLQRPPDWEGSASLQPPLLKGLRSSNTWEKTLKILCLLAKTQDNRLIDPSGGRIRDLYTLSLPCSLYSMTSEAPEDALRHLAESISVLAVKEGKQSISKIMTSFAKNHFRTRDDFLRQSVASLREHYGQDWTEIASLLLGLVLNRERWVQVHAMQILKVLFQQPRSPLRQLGSELLMPLLRLLETDLAPQALDVLEESILISGGAAARHVLRMSMHMPNLLQIKETETDDIGTVFGIPDESGWSVARADELRETCRHNVMAVFDTCSMATRPSCIEFEPEVEALASCRIPRDEMDGLVKDLHELTSFFQDEEPRNVSTPHLPPNRRLEARVAAILAKSTASANVSDVPQTPFLDVFSIARAASDEDEDEDDDSWEGYSDTDSEEDAFIFDSPTAYRSAPNGNH